MESSRAIIPPYGHKRKQGSVGDQCQPPPRDANAPGMLWGGQSKGNRERSPVAPIRECWHREHPVLAKLSRLKPASSWTGFEVTTEA